MEITRKPFEAKLSHVEIVEHYRRRMTELNLHLDAATVLDHLLTLLHDHDCHYRSYLERKLSEMLPSPSVEIAS